MPRNPPSRSASIVASVNCPLASPRAASPARSSCIARARSMSEGPCATPRATSRTTAIDALLTRLLRGPLAIRADPHGIDLFPILHRGGVIGVSADGLAGAQDQVAARARQGRVDMNVLG